MAGFRIRDGNVTAVISDELERLVRLSTEAVLPGVLQAMERSVDPVLRNAQDQWRVRSGKSKAGLEKATTLDRGKSEVAVGIRDDVDYAIYVRDPSGKSTAWQTLVRGPMELARQKVVDDLGPVVLRALKAQ